MNTDNTEIADLVKEHPMSCPYPEGCSCGTKALNTRHRAIVRPLLDRIAELEKQLAGDISTFSGALRGAAQMLEQAKPTTCGPNYGLPAHLTPHNPDNLTPEQFGHGYRALATTEIWGREGFHKTIHMWLRERWDNTAWKGDGSFSSYRVPADYPYDPDPALQPAWTLPEPPPGREWSRKDGWTQEMLPPGYRPRLIGEMGTYEYSHNGKIWKSGMLSKENEETRWESWARTTRPLPTEPQPEPLTLDQLAKRVAELETKLSKMEEQR